MTPSEETILAAARECGLSEYVTMPGQWHCSRSRLLAIYRAAFTAGQRAGMEAAAVVCDEHARLYSMPASKSAVRAIADAIRSAIKGEV